MPEPFPEVPAALLKALDKLFPEQCPDPLWTEREIWMKAGERRLVRFLTSHLKAQTDNLLKKGNP